MLSLKKHSTLITCSTFVIFWMQCFHMLFQHCHTFSAYGTNVSCWNLFVNSFLVLYQFGSVLGSEVTLVTFVRYLSQMYNILMLFVHVFMGKGGFTKFTFVPPLDVWMLPMMILYLFFTLSLELTNSTSECSTLQRI